MAGIWKTGEPGSDAPNYWRPGRPVFDALLVMRASPAEKLIALAVYRMLYGDHSREAGELPVSSIAARTGLSERSVTRTLKTFREQGVIDVIAEETNVRGRVISLQKNPRDWGDYAPSDDVVARICGELEVTACHPQTEEQGSDSGVRGPTGGDSLSPLDLTGSHPRGCQDVTSGGDTLSPKVELLVEPLVEPSVPRPADRPEHSSAGAPTGGDRLSPRATDSPAAATSSTSSKRRGKEAPPPTCDGKPCRVRDLKCGVRTDITTVAGAEGTSLYGGKSDLSRTFKRYAARVCALCQEQLPALTRPDRDEYCTRIMRSCVARIVDAHRGESGPIQNLPAYLNGELKRCTHLGDLCGDELLIELRREVAGKARPEEAPADVVLDEERVALPTRSAV